MAETLKKPYKVDENKPDDNALKERNLNNQGSDVEPRTRVRERMMRIIFEQIRRKMYESKEKYRMRRRLARLKREKADLERDNREQKRVGKIALKKPLEKSLAKKKNKEE